MIGQNTPSPTCAVCSSVSTRLKSAVNTYPLHVCTRCGVQFLHPQPDDEALRQIYGAQYFLNDGTTAGEQRIADLKTATAVAYLDKLMGAGAEQGSAILEIGCGRERISIGRSAQGLSSVGNRDLGSCCCDHERAFGQ